MQQAFITGSGLFTPPEAISNDELVSSFNRFVEQHNATNADAIAAGRLQALQASSSEFITKASGIKSRYVMNKAGVLDPTRLRPSIRQRGNDEPSILAEMAVAAAQQALQKAGRTVQEVDGIIVGCSNLPRAYPALAVEVQALLGCGGWAYDMNVACASQAFALQSAADAVRGGNARVVLALNPEICTGHLNFGDRDSHFIFGDAATALLVEATPARSDVASFEILGTRLRTQFSNNIRNNRGFLNRCEEPTRTERDMLFVQEGRKVFKDVVPLVAELLTQHLADLGIDPQIVKRFWLHQANLGMNQLIAKRVLGRDPSVIEAPIILDEYANTSSAGSVIAFHKYHADLQPGDYGVLSGFGAGYSAGSVVMRRC